MVVVKYSYLIGISLLSSCLWVGFAFAANDTHLLSPELEVVEPERALTTVEQGATSGQQLLELLLGLNNTQANFQQTLLDSRGQVLDQSSGTLALSKPSLRWEVNLPFTQVIVVADDVAAKRGKSVEEILN